MAVLLPVLLLAGLAKKLFAPLALTVAVAMIASYFVSMCVTPVACRYFLGHAEHGRLGKRVEARHRRVAEGYSRTLRARAAVPLDDRRAPRSCSSSRAAGPRRACRARSSPRSTSRWSTIYVRFAPGHLARATRPRSSTRWARRSRDELPEGHRRDGPRQRRHAAERAQRHRQPERRARTWASSASRSPTRSSASSRSGEIADRCARDPRRASSPASRCCSSRAASSRASSRTATSRRSSSRCAATTSRSSTRRPRRSPRSRAPSPACATCASSLQIDYPEIRVETDREKAGLVGVTARDAAQTTLEATLGNINTPERLDRPAQRPVVLRRHLLRRQARRRHAARSRSSRCASSDDGQAGPARRVRRRSGASLGPDRRRAQPAPARRARAHADRGARHRQRRRRSSRRRSRRTRARAHIKFDFVGQVELMRTTFSGLGLALGLAVMVVFMIMASQFKSLRLPFVMLFTIPVSLVGIVLALHGRRAGLLDHRADGHPDGHRHRRLERHPARRRREPPLRRGRRQGRRRSSPRRARASCRSR